MIWFYSVMWLYQRSTKVYCPDEWIYVLKRTLTKKWKFSNTVHDYKSLTNLDDVLIKIPNNYFQWILMLCVHHQKPTLFWTMSNTIIACLFFREYAQCLQSRHELHAHASVYTGRYTIKCIPIHHNTSNCSLLLLEILDH